MSDYMINGDLITAVANKLRTLLETNDTMTLDEMKNNIQDFTESIDMKSLGFTSEGDFLDVLFRDAIEYTKNTYEGRDDVGFYELKNDKNLEVFPYDYELVLDGSAPYSQITIFQGSSLKYIGKLDADKIFSISTGTSMSLGSLFSQCSGLIMVREISAVNYLPYFKNTSYMFYRCGALLQAPIMNTINVTDMNNMFRECKNLKIIPTYNTSNVTNMNSMFYECRNLRSVPNLDTGKVTNMYAMFYSCEKLEQLPTFDYSAITNNNGLYQFCYCCKALKAIPSMDLDYAGIKTLYQAFYGCESVVTVGDIDSSYVTNFDSAFSGCKSLVSVSSIDTASGTNFNQMFRGCTELVNLPQMDWGHATELSNIINSCNKLSDTSLNNILLSCISATSYTREKTLLYLGVQDATVRAKIPNLPAYQDFLNAGWAIY